MDLENGKTINLMKYKIVPIAGDASFRNFYIFLPNKKKVKLLYLQKKKNIKIW